MAEMGSNTYLQDRSNEIWVENLESPSTNPLDKGNGIILSIELEERKLALLGRQVKLRKEVAEVEVLNYKISN